MDGKFIIIQKLKLKSCPNLYLSERFIENHAMIPKIRIDKIDIKILRKLARDARTKLKDIAKDCNISSAAVNKRIKRLKAIGIITGSVQFADLRHFGFLYPAIIAIRVDFDQETRVLSLLKGRVNTVIINRGVGEDNLIVIVVAQNLQEIDRLKQIIKKQAGVRRIDVSNVSRIQPYITFDNIELQPTGV